MALSYDANRFLQVVFPAYAAKWNELSAIPGLEAEFARGFTLYSQGGDGDILMAKALNDASTDPIKFVKSNLLESMVIGNVDAATKQVQYLQQNNVPINDINNLWQENISKIEQGQRRSREGFSPGQLAALGLAVVVPVIGAEIGASLMGAGYLTSATSASNAVLAAGGTAAQASAAAASATATATTVGTAIASATAQVAQGVPAEDAIKNATVAATVQLNAPGAAKTVNDIVGNPAVTNLVVSTAASVVQTAATGGSEADIIRNAKGALVGSGVTSATDSNVVGRTAGGGVTGGVTGALMGAAGAIGSDVARPTGTTTAPQSGINLAAADTGTTTDAGTGFRVDVPGAPIYAEQSAAANVKAPFGYNVMPMSMADNKPEGSYYDVTQNAWLVPNADVQKLSGVLSQGDAGGQTPTSPTAAGTANVNVGGPVAGEGLVIAGDKGAGGGSSVSPADQQVLNLINPTPVSPTPVQATSFTPATFTPAIAPRPEQPVRGPIIDNFPAPRQPASEPPPATPTEVVVETEPPLVDEPPVEEAVPPAENEPPAEEENPPVEEEKPPGEEEKPDGKKEDKYKPDLFIYGGKTPKTPGRKTTNLGTTLQGPFSPSTTLGQALTGYRGAGEIEGKKTGKPRRDVWNEESLRLKDALGL